MQPRELTTYISLDTETTGTESDDQIWEISYRVVRDEHIYALRKLHVRTTKTPNPWVLENTTFSKPPDCPTVSEREMLELLIVDVGFATAGTPFSKAYLIGANPAFDCARLEYHYKLHGKGLNIPWDYHTICVENQVMTLYGLPHPPKLKECAQLLDISRLGSAHDSASDEALAYACQLRINEIQKRLENYREDILRKPRQVSR